MTFEEAMKALDNGQKVRLPEWEGYWFKENYPYPETGERIEKIKVLTRNGEILSTPWANDYKHRNDWEVAAGLTYGWALAAMKNGKAVCRAGWNGKGMFIYLNKGSHPEAESDTGYWEGIKYSLFEYGDIGTGVRLPNINMCSATGSTVTGWLASQTDMLAEDWQIADIPNDNN